MNNKIPYIKKADDVAFYYNYLIATDNGIDYRKQSEEMPRMKQLYIFAKNKIRYDNDELIKFCISKYKYADMILRELENEFKNRKMYDTYDVMPRIVCCNSCYSGTSVTPFEEIEEQREKYGEYICKRCEENSLKVGETQDVNDSLGHKLMIAKNGLYYDEGVRKRGTQWLGFAGSWYLIKTKNRNWLTNNLFITTGLHEKLLKNFEHNVNCEIYGVYFVQDIQSKMTENEFNKLEETTGYKYFIDGYNFEFMNRAWKEKNK